MAQIFAIGGLKLDADVPNTKQCNHTHALQLPDGVCSLDDSRKP